MTVAINVEKLYIARKIKVREIKFRGFRELQIREAAEECAHLSLVLGAYYLRTCNLSVTP